MLCLPAPTAIVEGCLVAYVQTDPRGAALYILDRKDIPEGATLDSCYSRGVAVYK